MLNLWGSFGGDKVQKLHELHAIFLIDWKKLIPEKSHKCLEIIYLHFYIKTHC